MTPIGLYLEYYVLGYLRQYCGATRELFVDDHLLKKMLLHCQMLRKSFVGLQTPGVVRFLLLCLAARGPPHPRGSASLCGA